MRRAAALATLAVAAACSTPVPAATDDATGRVADPEATLGPSPRARGTPAGTASPSVSPSTSPTPEPLALPDPGRPFDASDVLAAMLSSRRPGGIPDRLETDAIARAVAAEIWTIDGEPWTLVSVGGSCGPTRCTLEVGGVRDGSSGEDLWTFEVIPASGQVIVLDAILGALPAPTVEMLDAAARLAEPDVGEEGLILAGARWGGPDEPSAFELSYRSGDEEGSCELELRLDAESLEVETLSATGC